MDLMSLIQELEEELTDKRGLFSKKIDLGKCAEIIDDIKQVYPQSVREAEAIIESKNKILANADIVAKNTIQEADDRVRHMVDESELIRRAEIEAKSIIDSAYLQCDMLVERTKSHLDAMFKDIEQFLLSNLTMIRNNREELRGAILLKQDKNL